MRHITLLNEQGKKLELIISDRTVEKIIDAIYSDKGMQDISKGYIQLVNFLYTNTGNE